MRRLGVVAAGTLVVAALGTSALAAPPSAFQVRLRARVSTPLSDAAGNVLLAHVSPDGQHEVSWSGGTLTVSSTNGAVSRVVAHVAGAILYATWSPNDRMLAFETLDAGRFAVWVARVDGRGYQLVRDGAAQPAWAPDSRRLAFVDGFDAATFTGSLAIAAADGTGLRELTPREGVFAPSWSPDGRWIAYADTARTHSGRRVLLTAADGSGGRADLGPGDSASWSPDSRHVAIVRRAPHRRQTLVLADVVSHTTTHLVNAREIDAVAWSHAGTQLAYAAKPRSRDVITVATVTGGAKPMTFTPPARWSRGDVVALAWSRDDSTLYYSMRLAALKRRR